MGDTSQQAQKALRRKYNDLGGWQHVADDLGENVGFVWRIANGKRPAPNSILSKLGLPVADTITVHRGPDGKFARGPALSQEEG